MAFRHGKLTSFTITDSGTVVRDISTYLKDIQFPRTADTPETTAFQSGAKSYVVGLPGASINVTGMFDLVVDGYLNGILGLDAGTAFVYGPEGTNTGRRKFTGTALCSAYQMTASVADVIGFTATFQITGPVTVTVF